MHKFFVTIEWPTAMYVVCCLHSYVRIRTSRLLNLYLHRHKHCGPILFQMPFGWKLCKWNGRMTWRTWMTTFGWYTQMKKKVDISHATLHKTKLYKVKETRRIHLTDSPRGFTCCRRQISPPVSRYQSWRTAKMWSILDGSLIKNAQTHKPDESTLSSPSTPSYHRLHNAKTTMSFIFLMHVDVHLSMYQQWNISTKLLNVFNLNVTANAQALITPWCLPQLKNYIMVVYIQVALMKTVMTKTWEESHTK